MKRAASAKMLWQPDWKYYQTIAQPTSQYSHGSQNPITELLLHVSAFWAPFNVTTRFSWILYIL